MLKYITSYIAWFSVSLKPETPPYALTIYNALPHELGMMDAYSSVICLCFAGIICEYITDHCDVWILQKMLKYITSYIAWFSVSLKPETPPYALTIYNALPHELGMMDAYSSVICLCFAGIICEYITDHCDVWILQKMLKYITSYIAWFSVSLKPETPPYALTIYNALPHELGMMDAYSSVICLCFAGIICEYITDHCDVWILQKMLKYITSYIAWFSVSLKPETPPCALTIYNALPHELGMMDA